MSDHSLHFPAHLSGTFMRRPEQAIVRGEYLCPPHKVQILEVFSLKTPDIPVGPLRSETCLVCLDKVGSVNIGVDLTILGQYPADLNHIVVVYSISSFLISNCGGSRRGRIQGLQSTRMHLTTQPTNMQN